MEKKPEKKEFQMKEKRRESLSNNNITCNNKNNTNRNIDDENVIISGSSSSSNTNTNNNNNNNHKNDNNINNYNNNSNNNYNHYNNSFNDAYQLNEKNVESSPEKSENEADERERGLAYIFDVIEKGRLIKRKHINRFFKDLELPTLSQDDIDTKLLSLGLNTTGLQTMQDFFKFINSFLREYNFKQTMDAFKLFDKLEEGFIGLLYLRELIHYLGDGLSHEEVDDAMRRSDIDGDGTINYEEVCKQMFNAIAETLGNESNDIKPGWT